MHYILVEDFNQEIKISKNCIVIALSPDAIYKLEKLGINYILLEDFIKMNQLYGDTESYLNSQIAWFKEFDDYIKLLSEETRTLNINFATLYFYNIKYLIDQVIVSVRLIKTFIEKKQPKKITFISQVIDKDKLDRWQWYYFGESSISRVIEPCCELFDIPVTKVKIYTKKSRRHRFLTKIDFIDTIKYILPRKIKTKLKYERAKNRLNNINRDTYKGNILVIKTVGYVEDFCKDAIKNGYKIIFFNESKLDIYACDNIKINSSENKSKGKKDKLLEWICKSS